MTRNEKKKSTDFQLNTSIELLQEIFLQICMNSEEHSIILFNISILFKGRSFSQALTSFILTHKSFAVMPSPSPEI